MGHETVVILSRPKQCGFGLGIDLECVGVEIGLDVNTTVLISVLSL